VLHYGLVLSEIKGSRFNSQVPFPNTISSSVSLVEAPGRCGPFAVGGNLYIIAYTYNPASVGAGATLKVYKSTDLGVTWTAAGLVSPPVVLFEGFDPAAQYTVVQDTVLTNKLWVVYIDNASGNLSVSLYDANTDLWSLRSGTGPIFTGPSFGFCAVFSSGTLIIAGTPDLFIDSNSHSITSVIVFDTGPNTFGSWTDLGFVAIGTVAWNQLPCGIILDGAGLARVFMQQTTSVFTPDLGKVWQQSYNPSGAVLGALADMSLSLPADSLLKPFDAWYRAGVVKICITGTVALTNANISVGHALTSADPLVFTYQTFSAGNAPSTHPTIGGFDSSPALAIDPATGNTYCVYMSLTSVTVGTFQFRQDLGAGFGAANLFGTLASPGSRIQANFVPLGALGLVFIFGTPIFAQAAFTEPI
jgi:hypothetical protein